MAAVSALLIDGLLVLCGALGGAGLALALPPAASECPAPDLHSDENPSTEGLAE